VNLTDVWKKNRDTMRRESEEQDKRKEGIKKDPYLLLRPRFASLPRDSTIRFVQAIVSPNNNI
jgi:hypothetical protein